MAGTANDFRLTGRVLGHGLLWGGLSVPSAGSRLLLAAIDADGFFTPDATANPNAYPIGATKDGVVVSAKSTRQDQFADEITAPIDSVVTQVAASISASLLGINDAKVAKLLSAGFGTQTSPTGFVDNKIGYRNDAFEGIALIAPMREDPTKVFVFHLYKAINDSGFEFGIKKNELGSSSAMFKGYAISTRTPTDQIANHWWTTA